MKKPQTIETVLEKIVGGGQALGSMPDGRKLFVWGGLPGETVQATITKKKSHFAEGIVTDVVQASPQRIQPRDPESYLSTSPWQIMDDADEHHYKAALIEEAFELHDIVLPHAIDVYSDGINYGYRNKVEFSWYGQLDATSGVDTLHLAFFRRGSHGKIPVEQTSLARPEINTLARQIRDLLRTKPVAARNLKTLLIRCNQNGDCVWQLYVKDSLPDIISADEATALPAQGGEIIYSDPRSPASRITERLAHFGDIVLEDTIMNVPFRYATEGFFQVNLPVYQQALLDMQAWIPSSDKIPGKNKRATSGVRRDEASSDEDGSHPTKNSAPTVDLYSGVGTIGLTIGGDNCTLVEIDENAVREMRRNIKEQASTARAVLAPSEKALDEISGNKTIIVDPPRAGMHPDVIATLRSEKPARIIYLSCNPVTQARDCALLCADNVYGIRTHRGYNFFPRTPHIEHLVVLDRKS